MGPGRLCTDHTRVSSVVSQSWWGCSRSVPLWAQSRRQQAPSAPMNEPADNTPGEEHTGPWRLAWAVVQPITAVQDARPTGPSSCSAFEQPPRLTPSPRGPAVPSHGPSSGLLARTVSSPQPAQQILLQGKSTPRSLPPNTPCIGLHETLHTRL